MKIITKIRQKSLSINALSLIHLIFFMLLFVSFSMLIFTLIEEILYRNRNLDFLLVFSLVVMVFNLAVLFSASILFWVGKKIGWYCSLFYNIVGLIKNLFTELLALQFRIYENDAELFVSYIKKINYIPFFTHLSVVSYLVVIYFLLQENIYSLFFLPASRKTTILAYVIIFSIIFNSTVFFATGLLVLK